MYLPSPYNTTTGAVCVQTRTNVYRETWLHLFARSALTVCSWGQIEAKCIRNDTVLTRTRAVPCAATSSAVQGRAFWLKTNEQNPLKCLTFSLLVLPIQVHGCSPLARQQTLVSSPSPLQEKVESKMCSRASNGRVTMEHRARAFSRSLSLLPSLFLSFTHLVFLSQSPHSADSGDGREKVWRERDEGKEWWVVRPCHRQLMARALKSQFVWMKSSKLGRVFVNRLEQRYNTSEDCSHAYFMIICWKCHKHFLSPSHLNAKSHCVLIKWWSSLYKTKLE